MDIDEELYTPIEVAAKLKVTKQAIYKWMQQGRLEYVIVGSERRVTASAIRKFIQEGTEEEKRITPGLTLPAAKAA